jgi:hypothetical protein
MRTQIDNIQPLAFRIPGDNEIDAHTSNLLALACIMIVKCLKNTRMSDQNRRGFSKIPFRFMPILLQTLSIKIDMP